MLDTFKSLGGKRVQQQTDELKLLIASAREERSAISTMLNALASRSAKLAPLGKHLEQATTMATSVTERLDDIGARLGALEERTRALDEIDKRIQSLKDAAGEAEQRTLQALGPDGELHRHREAVQHLSSQALQTQAIAEAVARERAALEEMRGGLRDADRDVKQALGIAGALKGELDQVRSAATTLQQDYAKIRETSREAREDTSAALATVKEVEKKLGPLAQIHELSQSTEDRLNVLNTLAEHVALKTKALEGQQQAVEHASVQANRVNEMVWSMEVQIGKLIEGMKQAAKAEEAIGRIEKLSRDTASQLESAAKDRQEGEWEMAKLANEAAALFDSVRGQVDAFSMKKKEFETLDERVRALQGLVGNAESRMEFLVAKDRDFVALGHKIDALTTRFEALFAEADELAKKQLALESLNDQLAQVDELAKKSSWQMGALRESRQDLDVLRSEVQDFYRSHAEIEQLRDKLGADRLAIEAFCDRMNSYFARTPDLETRMDAILGQLKLVDEGTQKAARFSQSVAELDAQISRVTARVPFVEKLEKRLDGLNALSSEVNSKLSDQLTRRAELDTLKAALDGVGQQTVGAQHGLEAVQALQTRLAPLVAVVNTLKKDIATAHERIGTVKVDEATVGDQEKRLAEIVAASKALATDVAERARQSQGLSEELARSTAAKDELLAELDRVQSRQRDAVSQIQASEDQLARAEKMLKVLDQRRAQVAFGEKRLAGIESRLSGIKQLADELEKHTQLIAAREQVVNAVKAEVDAVHEIGARSRADLAHVTEHRAEVATLRTQVDLLLSKIADIDDRIASIDARRRLVDEVQTKTTAIVHMLDDVRINLEMLGEQKAVVDHVAEKAAQLDYMLQEARNAVRSLQHERELAERIEKSVKQLRSKTSEEGKSRTA